MDGGFYCFVARDKDVEKPELLRLAIFDLNNLYRLLILIE